MRLFAQHPVVTELDYSNTDLRILNYWVIASRGSYMIRVSDGIIEGSKDGGNNWTSSIVFVDADKILSGYLFSNGNVSLFTKDNKIYKTNIDLSSISEVTLLDKNGVSGYSFHTPQNAEFPGAYLECEDHMSYSDNGVYCLANYCNSVAINGGRGASAVITPITDDYGETYTVSYEFGQNVVYRDNGTALGGGTGTLLGDSNNTNVCRHVHTIEYNSFNNKYYMNTGDQNDVSANPDMDEIGWYIGDYDSVNNTINWTRINFGSSIEKEDNLKATGMFFTSTHIYWGSDANPVTVPDNQGIWRSPIDTFSDINTHELWYALDTDDAIINMKKDDNTDYVLATLVDSSNGRLNRVLAIKDFNNPQGQIYSFDSNVILLRMNGINEDGYFRLDMSGFDTLQSRTALIKIGEDLFNNL